MASWTAERKAASTFRPSAKIRPMRVLALACKFCLRSDTPPEIHLVGGECLHPRTEGDQSWLVRRIVVHPPRRRQRLIQLEEVSKTGAITSANRLLGYGVTSQAHTISDPGDRQLGKRQPEKHQVTLVAASEQPANARSE
jgi:hypothetical protein